MTVCSINREIGCSNAFDRGPDQPYILIVLPGWQRLTPCQTTRSTHPVPYTPGAPGCRGWRVCLAAHEFAECGGDLFGRFFGHEVAAGHGGMVEVWCPGAPECFGVEAENGSPVLLEHGDRHP